MWIVSSPQPSPSLPRLGYGEDRDAAARRARGALGGSAISFEDAWRAHRLHAAYGVIASFLSLVPPYDSEARRLFTSNFRARAMAAIDELDSVAALREAGIVAG
jgi:hypothetical protein